MTGMLDLAHVPLAGLNGAEGRGQDSQKTGLYGLLGPSCCLTLTSRVPTCHRRREGRSCRTVHSVPAT